MDIGALGVYVCLFLALYFEVFLLISFFEKKPHKKTASLPASYPTVTIAVPAYNEEKTILATLESLMALEYPKDKLDIMVIDDGSRDRTREIAQHFAATHPQVSYHYKENGGKYTALNFAIEHSTAELIGCLDADSFASPDALIEVVKSFEANPDAMALMPVMKVHHPKSVLELMQSVEYTFGVFYRKMIDNVGALHVLPGPFSFYRRKVFSIIGPFRHAHNTEDMEIAFRMHKHGLRIINAHTAYVYTTVPKTVKKLLVQRVRWSQGFLQNSIDYAYMYFNPKFGNFGMLTLPFGLLAFFLGVYTALYSLYTASSSAVTTALDLWATGVPLRMPSFRLEWFYLDTSMLSFIILISLGFMIAAIILGQRIGGNRVTIKALISYFVLFGLIAPVWLLQASWGTIRAREANWR
ncbi:MAG TPA: glycosyltransferase family 2 protein [Candidatus Paceibacterota bacterium]|nr:glycosyltransferase family 2 protein [Candidatus Paceibacterota bacterium]